MKYRGSCFLEQVIVSKHNGFLKVLEVFYETIKDEKVITTYKVKDRSGDVFQVDSEGIFLGYCGQKRSGAS
ncbi:MAG: hypothetical protein KJ737_11185 [Proteobacteria bacterium]|nr:hypothetical protein [Pseudomonadota bacterium]